MRILMLNTHASVGGAATAMFRLHRGLRQQGHDSHIIARLNSEGIREAHQIQDLVEGRFSQPELLLDMIGRHASEKLGVPYSKHRSTKHLLRSKLVAEADIIHLHNLHGDYFNYNQLPSLTQIKPTVWTLHDMWALTGHCAYSFECERWKSGCHDCPLLVEPGRSMVEPRPTLTDRTRSIWNLKRNVYKNSQIHVVAPSTWLFELVNQGILSNAASIHHIPYGIDLSTFRPRSQAKARWALDIPQDDKVILFVAEHLSNGRKGYQFLKEALAKITNSKDITLAIVGSGAVDDEDLGRFNTRKLGRISDESLFNLAFCFADLFLFPSLADNLPLVVLEALASGTPIIAFDVGGVPDMVRHMETGYLAKYRDSEDLARGVELLLGDMSRLRFMAERCREVAESEYALNLQVERYVEVYKKAIHDASH